jgi:hypothetical protein
MAGNRAATARLLAEVDRLDKDEVRRRYGAGFVSRWLRRISRLLTVAVVVVLVVDGWYAYEEFFNDEPVRTAPGEPGWSALEVWEEAGRFGGQVTIDNPTARHVEMYVDVDLFEGEQNVGDLSGSIALKPDSEAIVQLAGSDPYVEHDDEHVTLLGLPD